jgi:rubrerythrin
MELKKLNVSKIEQLKSVFPYFEHYYICNLCGSIYGADFLDASLTCPLCSEKQVKKQTKSE